MDNFKVSRRDFIRKGIISSSAIYSGISASVASSNDQISSEVVNPRNRVPVSFIIDDSTALVNMAYYGIPQFQEVFPDQYRQEWKKLPREIPDDFVREFRDWCGEHGVKGKYSMVPYPACTGWLHRFIPGWSQQELSDSLKLVRETMTDNWDIHPEMISHTRVINTKTGLPYPYASPEYMENWEWSQNKSSDELANYIGFALNVLKEAGFVCEGITTPGGFGSRNMENLAMGTLEAQKDVYQTEIPHFFRNVITDPDKSVAPELFHVADLETNDPRCAVHIIGCTDDWFGGWDGLVPGHPDKFITQDLSTGRMVEVIEKQEPAIMVCHWPGIYYNGEKTGFNVLKEVVQRIHQKYNNLYWMTLSEIARYWAAKNLTKIEMQGNKIVFSAPFSAKEFTLRLDKRIKGAEWTAAGEKKNLQKRNVPSEIEDWTFYSEKKETLLCFGLPKGRSEIIIH